LSVIASARMLRAACSDCAALSLPAAGWAKAQALPAAARALAASDIAIATRERPGGAGRPSFLDDPKRVPCNVAPQDRRCAKP
jgi:hypothetical protein